MLGLMKGICPHRKKLTHQYPSAADENRLSSRIEASAGRWVDYLLARGDVDPSRIALFGDGLGGSLATRIASRDHRFAAAERHGRIFAIRRIGRDQAAASEQVWMAGVTYSGTMLKCPPLMTIGQHDYIAVENAIDVHESCKRSGAPLASKVFSTEETAASPGHIDNPTFAKEFVFDWPRRKQSARPSASPRAWKMRVTAPGHDADPNGTASWIRGTVFAPGRHLCLDLRERIMRMSSSLGAPSAVAILSSALLCGLSGTATSQTQLPSVTIAAPKQVARPQRPVARPPQRLPQVANTVASRPTSPTPQTPTAQTTAPAQGSVMAKLAALEKTSSNCTDGCQTSFKYGNQPWNGCSASSGDFTLSTTCRNGRNYKTYQECRETGMFLAWRQYEVWWYCSSLHAAGKLSGEKQQQVAELKRSGRR
jgi:dienelactone hydrolase